jgi:hypothetical protein
MVLNTLPHEINTIGEFMIAPCGTLDGSESMMGKTEVWTNKCLSIRVPFGMGYQ